MTKPLILIVDDIPANIHVLAQALRSDYRVKIATSGALALTLARPPDAPDLILLDVMMPDMDGHEVCRQLKADAITQRIPVIFVTARDTVTDEEQGLNLGAADYITKPFILAIARARIRNQVAFKLNTDLLESLAHIDGLTRLANRRRFDELLDVEWRRAARENLPLGLVFADVDYFKHYNDHYGHGAGDRCLIQVAGALKTALTRAGDSAARYGGEEFVALLPDTDAQGTLEVAERFREAVKELALPHAPKAGVPWVTISAGYASSLPILDQTPDALVEAADQALYAAKHAGRDCVQRG